MGTANEIELKFPLGTTDGLKSKLEALGFKSHGEVFESNIVLDTPDFDLRNQRRLLRLRQDKKIKLTWKEPHEDEALSERYKAKRESELELGDLETMRHIFHRMGYTQERVYEKYRTHFTRDDGSVAELDRMPHMGWFLELECEPEAMEQIAAELGLDTAQGIKVSYMVVFQEWCDKNGKSYTDLRFEDEEQG